jgi:hypothetical protein
MDNHGGNMAATGYTPAVPRRPHAAKLLRLTPELEAEIDAIARREYRTFTAQVVKMLQEWLEAHPEQREPPRPPAAP